MRYHQKEYLKRLKFSSLNNNNKYVFQSRNHPELNKWQEIFNEVSFWSPTLSYPENWPDPTQELLLHSYQKNYVCTNSIISHVWILLYILQSKQAEFWYWRAWYWRAYISLLTGEATKLFGGFAVVTTQMWWLEMVNWQVDWHS